MNGDEEPVTLWFTGLPGSGKTTLACLMAEKFGAKGIPTEILDGDAVRSLIGGVGFSKDERRRHILSSAFSAHLLNRNGISVTAAFISPYRSIREEVRKLIGSAFVEIFVDCPLSICQERDPKGLYRKSKEGSLKGLTGVDDPYEPPVDPEIVVKSGEWTLTESVDHISRFLERRR